MLSDGCCLTLSLANDDDDDDDDDDGGDDDDDDDDDGGGGGDASISIIINKQCKTSVVHVKMEYIMRLLRCISLMRRS